MHLPGYSKLLKIGEGGMAQVYRGIQDSLQRPVAIKLLLKDLSNDEETRRRFERESYIIARLNHPNIIHVIDRGLSDDDMPYFVMEFVEGIELGTATKIRQVSHQQRVEIIIQLMKALSYAHQNNVIHRDIKPDNILVDEKNNVKILDFGIAQFYEKAVQVSDRTSSGTIMGTYNYMSPEQRESSDNVTIQSDIYSTGVVMYELFTGKLPTGRFPDPSSLNGDVQPELNDLILQCLNQEPDARPASAGDVKNVLLTISRGAHLNTEMRLRAEQGITKIKSKFLLLDILREDKFGSVYLYQQKVSGTLLIVKKKISRSTGFEASNLLASLEHPNIVRTFGTSRNERQFILVQEYLSGGTLQDKLAFPLSWKETLNIASQICEALLFAHQNHIVHGHLRPTNILFDSNGSVKVTDFSLQDDLSDVVDAHYYHLEGEARSREADIYATGIILYQLFTGALPRREQDSRFIVRKHFNKLPEDIQQLITTMLSTIPESRDPDSLNNAVALLSQHRRTSHVKTFTDKPRRDKKSIHTSTEQQYKSNHNQSPTSINRLGFLFGILTLVFFQYLYFFDGQEKINHSMPTVYSKVVNEFQGILGHFDASGVNSGEDSRFY